MKRARQASVLVQANGLTDLLVAAAALRHRHVALGLAYGGLGALWLLAGVRHWRWRPPPSLRRGLVAGLALAALLLLAELLALC